MKTYCEYFDHWLYHPEDTRFICESRAKRFSECGRCRGMETRTAVTDPNPEQKPAIKIDVPDVDENQWLNAMRGLKDEYGIRKGTRRDETSARRIAILVGELYLAQSVKESSLNTLIVEKDVFDLAFEHRLSCNPLERELRCRDRKRVLSTWGVDKTSGLEGYTTQLKDWTMKALLEEPEITNKEEEHGTEIGNGREGTVDLGVGTFEGPGFEEAGIGPT